MEQTYKQVLQAAQNHFKINLNKLYVLGVNPTAFKEDYNKQYQIVATNEETLRVLFGNTVVDNLIKETHQNFFKTK